MSVTTPSNKILYPSDRGGTLVEVPSGGPIDDIFYFQQNGQIFKRVIDGPIRAQGCGIYANGQDMSARLQAALDHADINEVVFDYSTTSDIVINSAVTVPTGKTLSFYKGNRITGSGSVTGGIIHAGDVTECFSSTFQATPGGSTKSYYSARWFGCKGDGVTFDNVAIQKIWDFIAANPASAKPVYFPAGNYLHDNGTLVYKWNGTAYTHLTVKIFGERNCRSGVSPEAMTRFTCTANMSDKFILGMQLGRQIEISNIFFIGRYTIPTTFSILQVLTNPASSWAQSGIRDDQYSPHTCINIDPFCSVAPTGGGYSTGGWASFYRGVGTGGTSQVVIKGCRFEQAPVGVSCSINGTTLNAEIIKLLENSFSYNKVAVTYGQAQTKENLFNDNRIWENVRTIIDCFSYGTGQGAPPYVNGANIAGAVYELIKTTSPFDFHARDIFAETIGRIGILESAASQHTIQDSTFNFAAGDGQYPAMDFIVSGKVTFDGTQLLYYDGGFQRLKLTKPNNAIAVRGGSITRLPMTSSLSPSEDLKVVKLDNVYFYGESAAIYNDAFGEVTWNQLRNTPMFGGLIRGVSTAGSDGSIVFLYNETKYDDFTFLQTASVTKNLNGTASLTVTNATLEKIRVNDMLISDNTMGWKYWEDAVNVDPMPVLGRIVSIVGNTVSLEGAAINIPNTTTANVPIYVNFIRHFNAPIVGDITNASNVVTNVEFMFGLLPVAGMRLEHPFIPKGTYVVSTTSNSITLSANATGTMTDASIVNGKPQVTLYLTFSPAVSGIKGYLIEGAIISVNRTTQYANEGDRYYVNKSVLATGSSRSAAYSPLGGGFQRIALAKMKQGAGPTDTNTTYFLTDTGKEGMFLLDPADTTTAGNDATVIVASSSSRFKRVISNNFYDARWFGNATRTFSSTSDATTKIATAYRFIGLTVLVETAGAVDEYWWKSGTANGDLILK